MIRVGDLKLFQFLELGALAPFLSERKRTVRVTVNAPHKTVLSIVPMGDGGSIEDDVEPIYLATVEGLETVEFTAEGPFGLSADGDIYFKTPDGDHIHVVIPGAETFTRIAERRARNPELERLQQMLMANQERRMSAAINDLRQREAALAARETNNRGASPASGDSAAPKPANSAGEPASSAAPAPVGEAGGKNDPAGS